MIALELPAGAPGRTQPVRPHEVHQLWVCYECSTLVERPAGATGIVLCTRHNH